MKTLACGDDVAELVERIERLTQEDARVWGSMSIGEMVVHVREAYLLVLEDRKVGTVKVPIPGAVIKWLALRVPRKWPPDVPTIPELKVGAAWMDAGEFEEDKAGLICALQSFASSTGLSPRHPIFGSMRTKDWMRWGYLHADHHLRQFGR